MSIQCAAPSENGTVLGFEDVAKEYSANGQSIQALKGVSFTLAAGRFVALVGRSGCGKSTLLNLAGAMDFPTSGKVCLEGVSTSSLNDAGLARVRREKIGFIFQSFQLLHTLTAMENVELPLLLADRRDARARAGQWLEWTGIADLAGRQVHQLSGGQMQRLAIARALAHSPRLLLADEPTGNLDTATGNTVLELLLRVAREQKTATLMATHSLEAAALADIVVKMRDGRIEEIVSR